MLHYHSLLKTESFDNAILMQIRALIRLAIMVYDNYTMLFKYGNCTRLLKIKNKLKAGCFYKQDATERTLRRRGYGTD